MMPTRAEVEALRSAQAELTRLVEAELADFYSTIREQPPAAVRNTLLEFVPALVDEYGDVAATVSAEWFEATIGGNVTMATPVRREALERGVRSAAGHLWTPAADEIVGSLALRVDKWVKQQGRETIVLSSDRNNVSWARIPTGAHTCAFCYMLASRGAVYGTEDAAKKSHGKCDCVISPVRGDDDWPEDYDPDELYAVYQEAFYASDGSTEGVLAEMRRQNPDLLTDGIQPVE